jgi:hypothetical protein
LVRAEEEGRSVARSEASTVERLYRDSRYAVIAYGTSEMQRAAIARALIGKYAGDVADVLAPGGVRHYEVVDVHYL